ncbi:hypothetical protein HMPREF9404_3403 [Eggerthella sp. HGA1]|nr:hypothetical protein HMPREF9404_3403 [Eggerthella sp. HGA1]
MLRGGSHVPAPFNHVPMFRSRRRPLLLCGAGRSATLRCRPGFRHH